MEAGDTTKRPRVAKQRTDRVCERHFAPYFVLKTWSAEIDCHVLMSGKRRAGLSKDAVPSIFEGVSGYLSKKIESPRKKVLQHMRRELSCTSTRGKRWEEAQPCSLAGSAVPEQSAADANDDVGDAPEVETGCSNQSAFDQLFTSASSMSLPSSSWAVRRIETEGFRDVLFTNASVLHRNCDGPDVLFN